ncbi:putative diphthamide synthesis protein-domain-containing protein [Ampelomyces quisqualis]|uniref:2-(3-amino-3-carboxypropyl)histidine synthase subunit 2 n=1 Tax=Ampelomyces quisqualis TaxID=50730 RepID=A0A6A5Q9P1_AMPQU|nr:putative diphthamide synthesis protein-domain-containing protein [Ampelomyces quisqualis]
MADPPRQNAVSCQKSCDPANSNLQHLQTDIYARNMAIPALNTAPVLSTPDTHIFEDPTPVIDHSSVPKLSDEQVAITYEIERTVSEIKEGRWKRIALQFPDHMLKDAPRVYDRLTRGLREAKKVSTGVQDKPAQSSRIETEDEIISKLEEVSIRRENDTEEKLFILGDTSYGACCVDEVAAEHVDADVVVHYGRSCLSPPSRLPVIYVFTERPLDIEPLIATFQDTYPYPEAKVILMADIPYSHHISPLHTQLREAGYTNVHATSIVHDPSSPLPNRTIPQEATDSPDALREYALFHISDPPTSLLLTLSSRVASIHIYPTDTSTPTASSADRTTAMSLRRRYALLTSLSTTPIFGILINTLSVKNYMHILSHVQRQITAAGKKYYTFVVGKVNAAKVANFSEIGGWVVIGCWESSLIESKEFWRPMITPWELGVALQGDEERVWTGAWEADFQHVLKHGVAGVKSGASALDKNDVVAERGDGGAEYDDEEESAPPEFDLRTGRYVSHSRPMRSGIATVKDSTQTQDNGQVLPSSTALTKRANGDMVAVGGVASPGAEYLRSKRTWQGLGSDYRGEEEEGRVDGHAAKMEEGRSGIARGYVVGAEERRH